MAKLQLNFTPSKHYYHATLLVLMLGIFGSSYAIWQRNQLLNIRDEVQVQLGELFKIPNQPKSTPVKVEKTDSQTLREIENVANILQLPWETLLDAIQAANKPEILLIMLESETSSKTLTMTGQADDSQSLLEFLHLLELEKTWQSVNLVNETRNANPSGPNIKKIDFQLALTWR